MRSLPQYNESKYQNLSRVKRQFTYDPSKDKAILYKKLISNLSDAHS